MSNLPFLWPAITCLLFTLLSPTSSLNSLNGTTINRHEVIVARHGVVATDDGRCSKIGMDVLRAGGHAVDASVAAALCLGVVSPASSGIGGGSFMLVRLASGKARALDMRETAPMQASQNSLKSYIFVAIPLQNMYAGNATLKASGILSVAVPGALAGLHKAWKQHGKLPWERLVRPAEDLARRGFKVSPFLRMQMERTKSGILADKGLRDVFTLNGNLLEIGDICHNKKLAETLRVISKLGVKAFYNGSVGFNLIKDIQKAGGILTIRDLQRYEVKIREPISTNIMDLKVIGMPPPSSGGASMILMLNILARYGVSFGVSPPLGIHRQIEALKHVFAVRMNLGDPEFVDLSKVLSDMLSPKFAAALKNAINDNMTFDANHYGGKWNQIHDHGTSHVSIVDRTRNAVSMTNTVNSYFGSVILSPSTGIVLNNEMDDFSIPLNSSKNLPPPAHANFIRPGKRPLSSMSPTIVLQDGKLKAVLGASGGANIIAGTTELIPNTVFYENWTALSGDHFEVPADIRASLKKKGHVLESTAGGTICQFIVQELETIEENGSVGRLVGVSDPRKGGFPAGF
ncbi:hypothetical protein EZV62_004332 [Acer yangbiense]|uniref:Glutathione hydrolase n=1 Tax=Acer yangbiense TaxID=1000413 RepID=A0A5C7IJ46_9ROSI|nr:hypothetical protein EZV62_004332 [Acer yangbiense]